MEKFTNSFKGYNVQEVNKFVDEMTENYSKMLNSLKSKDAEIIKLEAELKKYKEQENILSKATLSATTNGSQITNAARNEAKMIIEDAKRNASKIVNDALLEAEKVEMQSERLKRNMVVFKRRMKVVIESQLQTIDDIEEIKLENE